MHAIAHGIDLVDVDRIARLMDDHADRFLERVYTEGERAYALQAPKTRDERLAARFAAKEAVLKALGTGWKDGIAWTDVEVVRAPSGEPGVRLTGRAAEVAAERGVTEWLLSLTHTLGFAAASAIGMGE